MTKSTVIEMAMEPEGVGTIDLSSTAILIIDMQVRWMMLSCGIVIPKRKLKELQQHHPSTFLVSPFVFDTQIVFSWGVLA
jgi:hypothetical protein